MRPGSDVKKKRYTEEQIIESLREADVGVPVKELCRKHGFSELPHKVTGGSKRPSRSNRSSVFLSFPWTP